MSILFVIDHCLIQNPVKLDRATLPRIGMVAVPRIVGPLENNQCTAPWFDFGHVILKIGAVVQDAQPTAGIVPIILVHIEQNGDDLGFAVGVNFPVALATIASDGIHGWAVCQIDAELLFHSRLKFWAAQFVDQI